MLFHKTKLEGLLVIEPELREDMRGYFTRIFAKDEFAPLGIDFEVTQANRSFTKQKGMLRGLHFQKEPKWEPKVVQCIKGSIYIVSVDLRKNSPTLGQWVSNELSAENMKMLYTPKGFANGFQSLTDNIELLYFMGEYYSPEHALGIRYDDPELNIVWPLPNPIMLDKDKNLPHFSEIKDFLY